MAVATGTISNFGGSSGYPWTFTSAGTINTTGAKALLVFITNQSTGKTAPTNVRFGGAAGQVMTHLGTADIGGGMIYAFGLIAPTQTATGVLYVNHPNANGDPSNYTVIPLTACDEADPFGSVDFAFGNNGATITNTIITEGDNSMVFSAVTGVFGPPIDQWTTGGSPTPTAVINNTTQTAIPMKIVKQEAGDDGSTVISTNQTQYNAHGILSVEIKDSGAPAAQLIEPDGIENETTFGNHLAKDPNVALLGPLGIAPTAAGFGAHTVTRQIVLFFDANGAGHTASGTPATTVERTSGAPNYRVSRASVPVVNGEKKYWEVTVDNLTAASIVSLGGGVQAVPLDAQLGGWQSNAIGWDSSGGARQNNTGLNGRPTYTTGDVLMFAMDMTTGALFGGKNGVWYNGTTVGNVNFTSGDGKINNANWVTSTPFYPALETGTIGDKLSFNFGKQEFIYEPPAGFEAMDTGGPPNQDLLVPGISAPFSLGSHAVENQLQIIAPESLYTAPLMGSVSATYIAHHEGVSAAPALGTPTVSYRTLVMGISNPILLGTPTLTIATWLLEPEGITADPAVGTPAVHLTIRMSGILTGGAMGDPTVRQIINQTGISMEALLGEHTVTPATWNLNPEGIINESLIGNPEANYFINIPGITNESYLGDHLIDYVYDDAGIYPQGINNLTRFGTPKINLRLYAVGILDAVTQFGVPVVQGQNALEPEGISLDPQLGDHQVNLILKHLGIENISDLGMGKVVQRISVDSVYFNSMLGSPVVLLGEWLINPPGILNNALLGTPRLNNEFSLSTSFIKMAGVWVAVDKVLVKHDGQWLELLSMLQKVDGSWQEMT